MKFLRRCIVLVVVALPLIGAAPAFANYTTSERTCSPDGGDHVAHIELQLTGTNNDGVRDTLTGYLVKYTRTAGFTLGTHNNEHWYANYSPWWDSADSGSPGVWISRNITNTNYLADKEVEFVFDHPNADDPSCFIDTWNNQS